MLGGALQDNGRATLVGPAGGGGGAGGGGAGGAGSGHTFGKARIQNVQQLSDGSGLAVTRQRYTTPSGADINGKGLAIDVRRDAGCAPADDAILCLSGGG